MYDGIPSPTTGQREWRSGLLEEALEDEGQSRERRPALLLFRPPRDTARCIWRLLEASSYPDVIRSNASRLVPSAAHTTRLA